MPLTIYGLFDEGKLFYVGRSKNSAARRCSGHRGAARRGWPGALNDRLRAMTAAGRGVEVRVLQRDAAPGDEAEWVARMLAEGYPLLNIQFTHLLAGPLPRRLERGGRKLTVDEANGRFRVLAEAAADSLRLEEPALYRSFSGIQKKRRKIGHG